MLTELANAIEFNKEIIVFGCGEDGIEIVKSILLIKPDARLCFVDNAKERQGTIIAGVTVYPVEEKVNSHALYIITSINNFEQMKKQLTFYSIDESDIILSEQIQKKLERNANEIIKKRTAKNTINFVVDLAEHCNLNCQNCDHFSPLAEPYFTDIDEFRNDIKRMAELFGGKGEKITHVDLEGGEPLLNQNINNFITTVRQYMPTTDIKIFTNGILLGKKDNSFWKVCRDNNVMMEITKYPINFDYDAVENKMKEMGVRFEYYSGGEVVKDSFHKPIDLSGSNNKYDSFHGCYMGNGECTMLKHGKIYPCTFAPNISTFNKFFEKNIIVRCSDYIDIYKVETYEEIMDFLANPIPACRYCQPDKWTGGHEWKTTSYKIEEWADLGDNKYE